MLLARSCQLRPCSYTWYAPNPTIRRATRTTAAVSPLGPQLRLWLTLTGVIGRRPPPLAATAGRLPAGRAPADLEPADLEPADLEPVDLEPVDFEPVDLIEVREPADEAVAFAPARAPAAFVADREPAALV